MNIAITTSFTFSTAAFKLSLNLTFSVIIAMMKAAINAAGAATRMSKPLIIIPASTMIGMNFAILFTIFIDNLLS